MASYDYDFSDRRQAASQYVGLTEDPKSGLLTNFIAPKSKGDVTKILKGIEGDYDVVTSVIPVDSAWREVFSDGKLPPNHRWFSRLPEKQRKNLELFYSILVSKADDKMRENLESNQFAEALKKDWAHVKYDYRDGFGKGEARTTHMEISFQDSGNESAVVFELAFKKMGGVFKTNRPAEAVKILQKVEDLLSKISM